VFLAAQGHHVTAVDQSAAGLAKAALLANERHVAIHTVQADLATYVIAPGSWDAIVSIWCHVAAPLRRRLHRAVASGLRPGGVYLLEAYTPAQLRLGTGGPTQAELLATLAELRGELADLQFVHAVERERILSEGKKHVGLSAVVQVLARRP
jgi:2-polyprenyl-3-methyl-5-hydroxy-6-metoxy-1,4-benzoquinol methylase